MLADFLHNTTWKIWIKENPNDKKLPTVVNEFLKPDRIDPGPFFDNYEVLGTSIDMQIIKAREIEKMKTTKSLEHFKLPFNRPRAYPVWFMAGYPDVAYWMGTNEESLKNIQQLRGRLEDEHDFI